MYISAIYKIDKNQRESLGILRIEYMSAIYYNVTTVKITDRPRAGKEYNMKELAMDIIKMNKRGLLARVEIQKMFGCKLDEMTDEQKKIGLALLVVFEDQWNK